jgi:hypothetical protein
LSLTQRLGKMGRFEIGSHDSDFITANGTVVYLGEQTDKIDRFQRGVIKTVGDLV